MSTDDLLSNAGDVARQLGHRWIGPEHLVLALLSGRSLAGQALRASGITYDIFFDAVANLPETYTRRPSVAAAQDQVFCSAALQLLASAEGLAVGQGSLDVRPHDVLLALLYERVHPPVALQLIEILGASRQQLLDELGRLGITLPSVPLPVLPVWTTPRKISREELLQLATELQHDGTSYCFADKGEAFLISIAETGRRVS